MAERPILILPKPITAERATRRGGGGGPVPLAPLVQQRRLGPRLDELVTAFESKRLRLQTTASGLVPEDVLVLEVASTTVEDFYKAAAKIEGLEYLAEYDEEDIPPDDDFFIEKQGAHEGYRGRIYLMFFNQLAFRQLLNLWSIWQSGQKLPLRLTKWRDVFASLRDIRPWSMHDRLEETGVLEDWRARLEWEREKLPCEIELWFRSDGQERADAAAYIRAKVEELGGDVISEAVIADIHYHALAVRLPVAAVQDLLDKDRRGAVALVQAEQIQFFRSSGQMAGTITVDQVGPLAELPDTPLPAAGSEPVVALLDGLPLQSHRALAGRLSVDDPDDFGANYEARFRLHGTAMASLIIWGDLHSPGEPIPQPLYVRPIMQPYSRAGWDDRPVEERVSEGLLIVDLIHRAVRRMFEGEGDEPPAAPHIAVINLSIGICDRPFDGTMSPLARLLDWLSWKYRVLFLVSAGNYGDPIDLGRPWSELGTDGMEDIRNRIVKAVAAAARHRRLLSPAEAMNVLTIAASHEDNDPTTLRSTWIDPVNFGFPSPINAQGQGYKRSIKPDVIAPGGRVAYERPLQNSKSSISLPHAAYGPGQLVATPGQTPGDLSAAVPSRGTSNATAIMSRAAAIVAPVITELRGLEGGSTLEAIPDAVLLKALLVHGARWGEIGTSYQALFRTRDTGNKLAEYLTRLLGFGSVDLNAVRECTEARVTAIAGSTLAKEAGAEHRFPLPPSLSGKRGWRRLVVTLAWMTPINPHDHHWRRAQLWFTSPQSKLSIGSDQYLERQDADWQAVQRGTIQHEVFEGDKAAAFVDGDDVVIRVSCRESAGILVDAVPYALAVTFEADRAIGVNIYSEVRQRVQTKLRVAATSGPQ